MLHVAVENWTKILCLSRNFRKGDGDALGRNHAFQFCNFSVNMSRLFITIHNWVIHVQHFKTKGGFPPPRNFSVRTRVKKRVEAMYERPRINVKVESRSTLTFTVAFHTLPLFWGSQWGGGFYGYRLKFSLFYGYRLIFFSYG